MKKLLLSSLLVVVMCLGAISASAEPVKLKFASFAPPKAVSNTIVYNDWIKRMNAEGTVKVKGYVGGILGRGGIIYKSLMDGVSDMSFMVQDWMKGQFPDDHVFNLPFMSESGRESCLAASALHQQGLLRGYDDVKVLAMIATGVSYIHSTKPIRTPADMRGKKFAVGSSLQAAMVKQLGGIGVGIPSPKVAENMSRGIVEGWVADVSAVFAFRVNDVARHHLIVPFGNSTLLVAMNRKKYESLPSAAMATIDRHSGKGLVMAWANMIDSQVKSKLEKLQNDPKHTVIIPNSTEIQKWKMAVQPAIDKWKSVNPKREVLIKAYQAELDKIRAGM